MLVLPDTPQEEYSMVVFNAKNHGCTMGLIYCTRGLAQIFFSEEMKILSNIRET